MYGRLLLATELEDQVTKHGSRTVRLSCRHPDADQLGFDATRHVILTTVATEEPPFGAVLINDHVVLGDASRSVLWTNRYDPFAGLSFIAANITRIGLGRSVPVVPFRNLSAPAKMLATLDRMSSGRLIAGVGVGRNETEFKALGVPFHERSACTSNTSPRSAGRGAPTRSIIAAGYRTGEKEAGISSLFSCRSGRTPLCGGQLRPGAREAARTRSRSARSL